jgi:hypothetical protein
MEKQSIEQESNLKEFLERENETLEYVRELLKERMQAKVKVLNEAEIIIKELEYQYNLLGDIIRENKNRLEESK